jgi:hypothetical protein
MELQSADAHVGRGTEALAGQFPGLAAVAGQAERLPRDAGRGVRRPAGRQARRNDKDGEKQKPGGMEILHGV